MCVCVTLDLDSEHESDLFEGHALAPYVDQCEVQRECKEWDFEDQSDQL